MGEKIKSAFELAMEKLKKTDPDIIDVELDEDQKKQITEIRKAYAAKIAEREIMTRSKINDLPKQNATEYQIQKNELENELRDTKLALNNAMEKKVNEIRKN